MVGRTIKKERKNLFRSLFPLLAIIIIMDLDGATYERMEGGKETWSQRTRERLSSNDQIGWLLLSEARERAAGVNFALVVSAVVHFTTEKKLGAAGEGERDFFSQYRNSHRRLRTTMIDEQYGKERRTTLQRRIVWNVESL